MRYKLLIVAALSFVGACAPQFGDGCASTSECSVTGDRFCDKSQPGGYCTQSNCEPKSCGDDGVCVRFKPEQPRLSSSWCMSKCDNTGDCRDAYVCRSANQLGEVDPSAPAAEDGEPNQEDLQARAEVLDSNKNQKFCVVRE
jgi:hypothetical protein